MIANSCTFAWTVDPQALATLQDTSVCDTSTANSWTETATFKAVGAGTVKIRGKPTIPAPFVPVGDNLCTFTIVAPTADAGPDGSAAADATIDAANDASTADAGPCTEVVVDETFDNADWQATLIVDTGPGPTSFSASQEASGGNPGAHRAMTHEWCGDGNGSKGIGVAHIHQGTGHSGPLTAISFSYDVRCKPSAIGNGMAFSPMVKQGDTFYRGQPYFTAVANSWLAQGPHRLTADQFVRASGSGPAQPDFSGSGAAIEFGYYSANGTGSGSCLVQDCGGIDNYRACVHAQ
jgi:hypothetical protein